MSESKPIQPAISMKSTQPPQPAHYTTYLRQENNKCGVYVLSQSVIKTKVAEKLIKPVETMTGKKYTVVNSKASFSRMGQPFGTKTYENYKVRMNRDRDLDAYMEIQPNTVIVSFDSGITTDKERTFDFSVLTIIINGVTRQYTSFGIEIDQNLYEEYMRKTTGATKFGKFLSRNVTNISNNHWTNVAPANWSSDIRFGNIPLEVQLQSCVDQFILDANVRIVKDIPKKGVDCKDIAPILSNHSLLEVVVRQVKRTIEYNYTDVDYVAGIDAKGGYFAPMIASMLRKAYIPIRKGNEIPRSKDTDDVLIKEHSGKYSKKQYGVIKNSNYVGKKVLVIDDMLTTGDFMMASIDLLSSAGLVVKYGLTIYDIKSLRDNVYSKIVNPEFNLISICKEGVKIPEMTKYPCYMNDVKRSEYKITELMIKRLQHEGEIDNDNGGNDGSRFVTIPDKLWFTDTGDKPEKKTGVKKMKNVRLLYTEKDKEFASKILDRLIVDCEFPKNENPFNKYCVHVDSKRFSNGETTVQIDGNVRECHVFVINRNRTGHINNDLMELYFTLDACSRAGVDKISVILPYYPYSRSDKKDAPRVQIGSAVQANFLKAFDIVSLISIDLHAGQTQGLMRRKFENLYMRKYMAEFIHKNYLQFYPKSEWDDKFIFVAPDAGSVKRTKKYSAIFDISNIAMDKSRNYKAAKDGKSVIDKIRFIGDREDFQGKIGLIVDDMADTMGTMSKAVSTLVENGLKYAIVFVTHGILSGPAIDRINKNPHIKEVVVSNTLPQKHNEERSPKIRVVSVAEPIARTIDGCLTGRSISRLFH